MLSGSSGAAVELPAGVASIVEQSLYLDSRRPYGPVTREGSVELILSCQLVIRKLKRKFRKIKMGEEVPDVEVDPAVKCIVLPGTTVTVAVSKMMVGMGWNGNDVFQQLANKVGEIYGFLRR